jgi:hypothetical protein
MERNIGKMQSGTHTAMSTIEDVRGAAKKVQQVVDALKKAAAQDPSRLCAELLSATDEYKKTIRELEPLSGTKA